jgi:hypothetical protein
MAFTKGVKGLDILAVGVDLAVCSVGSNDRLGCAKLRTPPTIKSLWR